jgi:sugar (pentulose or hexulose) kinase
MNITDILEILADIINTHEIICDSEELCEDLQKVKQFIEDWLVNQAKSWWQKLKKFISNFIAKHPVLKRLIKIISIGVVIIYGIVKTID